jgi:hypothetical protein
MKDPATMRWHVAVQRGSPGEDRLTVYRSTFGGEDVQPSITAPTADFDERATRHRPVAWRSFRNTSWVGQDSARSAPAPSAMNTARILTDHPRTFRSPVLNKRRRGTRAPTISQHVRHRFKSWQLPTAVTIDDGVEPAGTSEVGDDEDAPEADKEADDDIEIDRDLVKPAD